LKTPGHVWFEAPGRFRWQLDEPPKTIAVRSGDQLRILYPVLQRIEEVDLNDASTGPWREAMILFEAGFPASRKDLEKRFEIRSQIDVNELHRVTLRPRTASARRWLRELVIELGRDDLTLRGTRLEFADGSTLHNEFREIRVNEPQDETLYRPTFAEVEVRVESGKVLP
jgi:outer membrane lipoprotein-sorting protein